MNDENSYFYLSQKTIPKRITVAKENELFSGDVTNMVNAFCWMSSKAAHKVLID